MIAVVLACCTRDVDQAIRVLEWSAELGMNPYELCIMCSEECNPRRLMDLGAKSFVKVSWIKDAEQVDSNWHENGNHRKSAAGPNSLFRQVAWEFHLTRKVPFLFWEPDAVPCHRGWVKTINAEWELALAAGKLFLGFEVNRKTHPGDVGSHMSGVAVYHYDLPQRAHRACAAGDVAFDIEGAEQIVPQMMPSRTIFHRYRPPSFGSESDFNERVSEGLALYHACKDGSIYPFLRKRLGLPQKPELVGGDRFVQDEQTGKCQSPAVVPMILENGGLVQTELITCDIFIKTREHDYPWLEWCGKSIFQFASGFRRLNILDSDSGQDGVWIDKPADNFKEKANWIKAPDKEPGYLWQQVCKLYADEKTDAEFILYMDSDCVFTRPVTPQEFIRNGKAIWQYTPLDKARPDQHHWIGVMEKFLGKRPEHEFMRRHPFIVQRWMLEALRTFCKYRHGKSLESYILGEADPSNGLSLRFSEWNCLGFFLWEYHRDRVEWVLDADAGPACTWQGHTHDTPEKNAANVAKMREVFLGSTPSQPGAVGDGVTRPPLSLEEAIAFIQSQGGTVQMPVVKKKRGGRPKGSKNKPKPPKVVSAPKKDTWLLAIHSYPGANETVERHWNNFLLSGATRIVGIGTTDDKCKFPCESVNIGKNAYIEGDHLCRRLIDTVEWCLTQPEDRFAIVEYDVLFLKKFPKFYGISAFKTGGQVNGSKTQQFHHSPWCFTRIAGEQLLRWLKEVLPECQKAPDNSPDLFFGYACQQGGLHVECPWRMFTRNSWDLPGDLDLAIEAALDGAHVLHGCKTPEEFQSLQRALNERHLELSHAQ